jgi:energy-coupling factor transport system ATP-binding protein
LLDKSPFELSGGQKRRVAIAGILAMEPEVLILDEPTAGLDPKGRDDILREIKKLHQEKGITVILVSHSMEDVAKTCEKVIVINEGSIFMCGDTREVFKKSEELSKMGLSIPQISYVLSELRNNGINVPDGILTVEEAASAIMKMLGGVRRD